MKSSLLEIDSLLYTIKSRVVLRNIQFKVETGDIVLILGRNGSGKSTLFKSVFGTITPNQRFVRLDGEVKPNPFEIKNGISFSTHFCHLPERWTLKKLIDLYIKDNNKRDILYKDDMISGMINQKISQLSYGMKSYFQTLLYLNDDKRFCILDEPFAGLSPLLEDKLTHLILEASKNKGIIISDHQHERIFEKATKKFILFKGNLLPIQTKEDLIQYGYINR